MIKGVGDLVDLSDERLGAGQAERPRSTKGCDGSAFSGLSANETWIAARPTMETLEEWLREDWLRENPMPDLQFVIENAGRRWAADRGEPYDPQKHRPGWEEIAAAYDEFDHALAAWRRNYIRFRLAHLRSR